MISDNYSKLPTSVCLRNTKKIKMKIHTKRHILHITLHKILSQYVTLSTVTCYLLLYIYLKSCVLARAKALTRHPCGLKRELKNKTGVLSKVCVCACGEGSWETQGKEEGEKIMQGRKRRLEKTSLPCSLLWATGGEIMEKLSLFYFSLHSLKKAQQTNVSLWIL